MVAINTIFSKIKELGWEVSRVDYEYADEGLRISIYKEVPGVTYYGLVVIREMGYELHVNGSTYGMVLLRHLLEKMDKSLGIFRKTFTQDYDV